jgi:hypothetical protein
VTSDDARRRRRYIDWLIVPIFGRGAPDISIDSAASRAQAYVYGNVLVLAALATLTAEDVAGGRAALIVGGTALSTFFAHAFAESVGHRIRSRAALKPESFRVSLRDSVPIASSGSVPTLMMIIAWLGHIDPPWAVAIAAVTIIARFLLLGSVMNHLSGSTSSWRSISAGVALAIAALVIAIVKLLLTH